MSSKVCSTCKESKCLSLFHNDKNQKDGKLSRCKSCELARKKLYYNSNSDVIKAKNKAHHYANRDEVLLKKRSYWDNNKDKINAKRRLIKGRTSVQTAKRRANRLMATPPWLSEEHQKEIQNLFWLTRDLRSVTGEEYHVDHIVPLTNEIVCGLHVPWNLQILPSDINLSKSNSFDDQEEGLNYAH